MIEREAPQVPSRFARLVEAGLRKPALLALEDGSLFRGESIGAEGHAQGEVVFNTAMTGYQEILTDPSYCQQIVTLTYPHIGNVGVNPEDEEATRIHASGLVVRDCRRLRQQLAQPQPTGRLSARAQRGRHRRHRHPPADPPPARKRRAERLHHGRRHHRRSSRLAAGPRLSRA